MERREARDFVSDRRAFVRGGRRNGDQVKAWYIRRPFLLTMASLVAMGWRRLRPFGRTPNA